MKLKLSRLASSVLLILALSSVAFINGQNKPFHFKVELARNLSPQPVSGRLLIFMTPSEQRLQVVLPSFMELDKVWVAASDIHNLKPGTPLEFDADRLAYPAPFST